MKYIDTEKLKVLLSDLKESHKYHKGDFHEGVVFAVDELEEDIIDSLQQEQPEPYFYCKYGGTIPLCSDCKRNHCNSPFKTEEITTWYAPSNGTKHCIDYIQQEQPEVDEMVKSAEDHAYFAGQEKLREKLLEWIDKMCEENKGFSEAELVVTLDKLKEKINSL